MSHRIKIESLAKKLGVTFSNRDPMLGWSWNGHNIATNNWKEAESTIVHEIAHWILCPEERLCVPDFGLGTGPQSGMFAASRLSNPAELREELRASVLGILYERALGMNWRSTYYEHNWIEEGNSIDFLRKVKELKTLGLVHRGGKPVVI